MTVDQVLFITAALMTMDWLWFTLAGGLMIWLILWALWSGRSAGSGLRRKFRRGWRRSSAGARGTN
jgi:hypothetical protein